MESPIISALPKPYVLSASWQIDNTNITKRIMPNTIMGIFERPDKENNITPAIPHKIIKPNFISFFP